MNIPLSTALILTVTVLLGGGCAAIGGVTPGMPVQNIQAGHAGGEKLLEALVREDFSAFIALLPEELRGEFTAEKFRETRKVLADSLGEPVAFRYLVTAEHPLVEVNYFLVRFRRRSAEAKEVFQEALFRVISAVSGGKSRIVSFNFI